MADYLEQDFDAIVDYLAGARIIHVTSFLDDRTASALLSVLRAAVRVLGRWHSAGGVVIVKGAAGVWTHRRGDGCIQSELYARTPLSAEQIEDATGAGDVFAAGLLVVLASQPVQIELGVRLGMQLARHKLQYVGNAGYAQFAQVTLDFTRPLDVERRSGGAAERRGGRAAGRRGTGPAERSAGQVRLSGVMKPDS